jgi:hypothetical protein
LGSKKVEEFKNVPEKPKNKNTPGLDNFNLHITSTRREQQHGKEGNHIHKNNKTYKEEPGQVQKTNHIDRTSG